ncbi:MAG TPA: ATP-grasp domain-containing protein [Anaerolineales bacterium]|nr:ATP-grasp domain-containing protein [Anaerolineales bacterium]
MPNILFAAPILNSLAIRFIQALCNLPDVRVGVLSQESQDKIPSNIRREMRAFEYVNNALDTAQLRQGAENLGRHMGAFDRLLAINEQIQVPLAEVREQLNILGTSAAIAQNFRDKARMKELLRAAGLPCARHQLATRAQDIWDFAGAVGFPVVIKPPAGAASQGTYRANSPHDLRQLLAGPLRSGEPVLLEEFITGEEFSFDTFSLHGKPLWHSWTQYLPAPLEVTRNDWMQWRVLLPREVTPPSEEIRPAAIRALDVLGMDTGLSHMEWFRRADGSIAISEVGMRPPGAQITTLMSRAHDFDCATAWAKLVIFGEFEAPERKYAAGGAYLRGMGQGRVRAVHGVDKIEREFGHLATDAHIPPIGQEKSSSYEGEGFIIVKHPETAVVEQALTAIVQTVRVELG